VILPLARRICHGSTENDLPLAKRNLPQIAQINTDFLFAKQIDIVTKARKARSKIFSFLY
jgi:hypothetical protein